MRWMILTMMLFCSSHVVLAGNLPTTQAAKSAAEAAHSAYDTAIEKAENDFNARKAELTKKYLANVKTAFKDAKDSGNLEDSVALNTEIDRITGGGDPDDGDAKVAVTARRHFDADLKIAQKVQRQKDDAAATVCAAALERAKRALTQAGDLAAAQQVQSQIESLKHSVAVSSAPIPLPAPGRPAIVDFLATLNLKDSRVFGDWTVTPTGLQGDTSFFEGALRFPYEPPAEYDYQVDFTVQKAGPDSFIGLQIPHEGIAGWAGFYMDPKISSQCAGWDLSDGISTPGPMFTIGKRYSILLEVRNDGVTAKLNNKVVTRAKTQKGNREGPVDWLFTGDKTLGLSMFKMTVLVSRMTVSEIKSPGTVVKLPEFGDLPSLELLAPSEPPKRVYDLLKDADLRSNTLKGAWHFRKGGTELVADKNQECLLRLPYHPAEEYDLRLTFRRHAGGDDVDPILTKGNTSFYVSWAGFCNAGLGLGNVNGAGPMDNVTRVKEPRTITNDRDYAMIVYIRNGYVGVSVDGKMVLRYATDYSDMSNLPGYNVGDFLGLRCWKSEFIFSKIEVAEITGAGSLVKSVQP